MAGSKSSLSMPSEADFIGSMVSIDCGKLGTYQGHVEKIDPVMNLLTITHAFRNGLPCDLPEVNLSSSTIIDIKIIHASHEAKEIITRKATPSKMTKEIDQVTKPTCSSPVKIIKATSKVRAGFAPDDKTSCVVGHLDLATGRSSCRRRLSPSSPSKSKSFGSESVGSRSQGCKTPSNDSVINEQVSKTGEHHSRKMTAAKKIERTAKKGANAHNSDCFSAPVNSYMIEFDFESNLALFNKKEVFREIENGSAEPTVTPSPREQKYRHDENILQPGEILAPQVMRQQIQTPETKSQLYYTDTGLVVPGICPELRARVCDLADQSGLVHARQLEAFGRAASEMVIHLIGGSHRIHPKNGHQTPGVVIMSGPHHHGAMGACCARILSCHGVEVTLVFPGDPSSTLPTFLTQEIQLCRLTGLRLATSPKELPNTIDLIVTAMDGQTSAGQQPWYHSMVSWFKSSHTKAPVLALDPPALGPSIPARWSLYRVLPSDQLVTSCGQSYLCDLSIPPSVFQRAGITYVSPFGSKFVIPMHIKE